MWGQLCGFICYNVQYVVFIVAYITLKWHSDIRELHVLHKWMKPQSLPDAGVMSHSFLCEKNDILL
jgi:hypothetical protein